MKSYHVYYYVVFICITLYISNPILCEKTLGRISCIVDVAQKLPSKLNSSDPSKLLTLAFLGDKHPHNIQFTRHGSICWLRPTSGLRVIPIYPGIKEPCAVKMGPVIREYVLRRVANWHPGQILLGVTTIKKHYASPPG